MHAVAQISVVHHVPAIMNIERAILLVPWLSRTGLASPQHPLDRRFMRLIQDFRLQGPPKDNTTACIMLVTDMHGQNMAFDFSCSSIVTEDQPDGAVIAPVSRDVLPKYTYAQCHSQCCAKHRQIGHILTSASAVVAYFHDTLICSLSHVAWLMVALEPHLQ